MNEPSRDIVAVTTRSNEVAPQRGHALPATDRLDLSESVNFFQRHLRLILQVTGGVMLAGLLISLVMGKTYLATATVMLTGEADQTVGAAAPPVKQAEITNELVETQADIITSRDMVNRVADALGAGQGLGADERRHLLDKIQHNVAAERAGKSYALAISFSARDPKAAADWVNEFARQYAAWDLKATQDRNLQARGVVEDRLVKLRDQAQADTRKLQEYRIANNLLSTSGASLTEQEISNYNQEVSRARAQAAEDEARLQTALAQLRSGSTGDDVGEALGSTVISALRLQETQAAAEVANLSAKYGPNYPQLIRSTSQLAEIRHRIQAEIGRVISNLRAKQDVSVQRLASLNASLAAANGKLSQNNAAMVELNDLERAATASQGIYEAYLNRYKELLAAEGSEKPSARVLSFAQPPLLPHRPNIPLNLALSLVIGLGMGVLAAYVSEALFHGLTTPADIERELGEPHLASIPLLASVSSVSPHALIAIQNEPRSIFTESFRTLGTAIDQASSWNAQVIAVTSALPGEGKTITSTCLAHVLASGGKRTMLIDCDLRRRGISRLLNIPPQQKGLIEVLNGTSSLNLETLDHDFCCLLLSPSDEEPDHLLTGQPFIDLLAELRQHFDRIILDLPPVLPIASAAVLASRADVVVMVSRWRETSSLAVRAALRRLPVNQVNLIGVALTQVDLRQRAHFNRHDPAFYYKDYSEYYS